MWTVVSVVGETISDILWPDVRCASEIQDPAFNICLSHLTGERSKHAWERYAAFGHVERIAI